MINSFFEFIKQVRSLASSGTGRSISIVTGGNLVSMVLGLLVSVYSLRFLSSEQVGIVYPLISFLLLINQIGDVGLSMTFLKLGSRVHRPFSAFNMGDLEERNLLEMCRQYFSNFFWLKLFVGLVTSSICFIFAKPISHIVFNEDGFFQYIRLVSVISVSQFLCGYFQSSLQVEKKFKAFMLSKLIPQFIKTAGMISIVVLGYLNLKLALLFFLQVPVLSFLISFFASEKRFISLKPRIDLKSEFFLTSRWVCISMIANTAMASSDVIMTRSLVGAKELSIYLGGQKLASILPVLSSSLLAVLLPKVSSMKSDAEIRFFVRKALRFLPIFSGAIILCIPMTGFIVDLLLGQKYLESVSVFDAFLVVHAFAFLITPLGTVLYRLDKEKVFTAINVAQLIANILLNWLLIPRYGAIGAAGTTLVCKVIAGIVIYYILFKNGYLFYKGKTENE